jgi:hypothetical protein
MFLWTLMPMDAVEELRFARAASLGIAQAMGGDDTKLASFLRSKISEAYPERWD